MSIQVSPITVAVDKAVKEQSPWARRKDTIVTVLTGLAWLAGVLIPYTTDMDPRVGIALGATATIAGALVNAFTKGAITPSMATRLYANSPEAVGYGYTGSPFPYLEGDNPTLTEAGGENTPVGGVPEVPGNNVTVTKTPDYAPRHALDNSEVLPNSAYMAARSQFFEE